MGKNQNDTMFLVTCLGVACVTIRTYVPYQGNCPRRGNSVKAGQAKLPFSSLVYSFDLSVLLGPIKQ